MIYLIIFVRPKALYKYVKMTDEDIRIIHNEYQVNNIFIYYL